PSVGYWVDFVVQSARTTPSKRVKERVIDFKKIDGGPLMSLDAGGDLPRPARSGPSTTTWSDGPTGARRRALTSATRRVRVNRVSPRPTEERPIRSRTND